MTAKNDRNSNDDPTDFGCPHSMPNSSPPAARFGPCSSERLAVSLGMVQAELRYPQNRWNSKLSKLYLSGTRGPMLKDKIWQNRPVREKTKRISTKHGTSIQQKNWLVSSSHISLWQLWESSKAGLPWLTNKQHVRNHNLTTSNNLNSAKSLSPTIS